MEHKDFPLAHQLDFSTTSQTLNSKHHRFPSPNKVSAAMLGVYSRNDGAPKHLGQILTVNGSNPIFRF